MKLKLSPKLEKKRRSSARIALYTSLVAALAALVPGWLWLQHLAAGGVNPAWTKVDYTSLREVQVLRDYVRIDTSPDGSEVAGAEYLAALIEETGVPATIEHMGNEKANLWAIIEGKRPAAIVLHNHIDTDPVVDREAWDHDPHGGVIEGPRMFGRGIWDMKSAATAQLMAFLEIAARPDPPEYSIIFLATGSEEIGSELGTLWVLRQHPELVERFVLFLTEGGVIEATTAEDIKYWGTEFSQKRYLDFVFCSDDRRRLDELRELLIQRRFYYRGFRVHPDVDAFLGEYAETRGWENYRELNRRRRELPHEIASFEELQPYVKHMLRNEYAPFLVEPDAGGGYRLLVKMHLLPDENIQEMADLMFPKWLRHGFDTYLYAEDSATSGSPVAHPVMQIIDQVVKSHYPNAPTGPMFLATTATDARFTRRWGIPSYGFSPFPVLSTDTLQIGQPNERLLLPGYVKGVEIYRDLVESLVYPGNDAREDLEALRSDREIPSPRNNPR